MNVPIIPDKRNPTWKLYGKVIKLIDSRTFQQKLARK